MSFVSWLLIGLFVLTCYIYDLVIFRDIKKWGNDETDK